MARRWNLLLQEDFIMKKIFTLTVFSLVALLSFADDNRNDGKLSITNLGKQDIRVEVDGRLFDDVNNVVTIPELTAGYHTVKVYRNKQNGNRAYNVIGRKQLLYSSTVTIKPRTELQITLNRNGQASINEVRMNNGRGRGNGGYGRDDRDGRDRNERDWDNDRNDRYDVISDRTFTNQLEALQRERFEATRFDMAKQLIGRSYFTTTQVKQIAQTFSFENNRLELAKTAYSKTVDKQYYAVMYDVLSSANSRRELAQYMNDYR